jgi:hypothetical protein
VRVEPALVRKLCFRGFHQEVERHTTLVPQMIRDTLSTAVVIILPLIPTAPSNYFLTALACDIITFSVHDRPFFGYRNSALSSSSLLNQTLVAFNEVPYTV